jgi:hypothetical protein
MTLVEVIEHTHAERDLPDKKVAMQQGELDALAMLILLQITDPVILEIK